ncbi:MAG: YihY/virulence factor BrkB family protein [Desulfobacterales bacterium]|nr:YihY/virulence factor BrkB family protein [Desulfobacterales bacterium]
MMKTRVMHLNIPGYNLFSTSLNKFVKDDCVTLSLSVSFVFLLSIIPFTTLSILIFDLVKGFFISNAAWAGNISEILAEEINHIIPFVSKEWIKSHVINPDAYGSFKAINFLMLPIISGLFFKSLETSYRKIFQLPPRHLFFGQAFYVIISVFAGLLFFMSNFIWIIFSTIISHILTVINSTPYVNQVSQLAMSAFTSHRINLLSVVVLIVFYLVTIKLFLNVKIRLRHRLASAVIFCVLWLVARHLFSIYISHITEVSVLYGSLSSVIVILMWIFYSSLALLYSVEVLYALHSGYYHYRQW